MTKEVTIKVKIKVDLEIEMLKVRNIIKDLSDLDLIELEIVHNGSANAYALLNEYGTKCALTKHSKVMCDKINEIIDKLNEMEKE